MLDEPEQIPNLVIVAVSAFLIILIVAVVMWAKSYLGEIQTRGSAVTIATKVLSAPCLTEEDFKGVEEKYIFRRSFLNRINNSMIPESCLSIPWSNYFVEIRTDKDMWRFGSPINTNPYAYHALSRGLTLKCTKDFPYKSVSSMYATHKNVFDYDFGMYSAVILKFSGGVRNRDSVSSAHVRIIVDPDSTSEFYKSSGAPLCLEDVVCPPLAPGVVACHCIKEGKCVAPGSTCTGAEVSCTT